MLRYGLKQEERHAKKRREEREGYVFLVFLRASKEGGQEGLQLKWFKKTIRKKN